MEGPPQRGVGCSMGPPFLFIEGGGSQQGKVGFTPLYPAVNPTPPLLPVPHWGELKFPRVINPDPPLNDSRQLDWQCLLGISKISRSYILVFRKLKNLTRWHVIK